MNKDPEEEVSNDIIKASFDLLEDKKIIIPLELDGENRFKINTEYDHIFSKILQLFDSILDHLNAKWKLYSLNQMEENWFVSMYGKTYVTRKNLEMFTRRNTIIDFEKDLIQSDIKRY
jgi:hypothetical protein